MDVWKYFLQTTSALFVLYVGLTPPLDLRKRVLCLIAVALMLAAALLSYLQERDSNRAFRESSERIRSMEQTLNDLKSKGIECALVRKDGVLIYSTLTLDDATPGIIAALSGVSDEMLKRVSDRQKEVEIALGGLFFVIVPFGDFLLCGAVKDRELKKELRAAADILKEEKIE